MEPLHAPHAVPLQVLCQKLNGDVTLEYSKVMSLVFILLQLVMIRACNLH